ncbi:MAG: arginase family protein [Candidatus Bathyarchaeota archaeon]|jgi:arginase|nr:arginase family protein [Candidatus Bathyarchaeota archaeon]
MNPLKVGVAKFIHDGNFGRKEFDEGPDLMENGGLYPLLERLGVKVVETRTARLTPEEERQYGTINRFGLAGHHLAEIVSTQIRQGSFNLGLLSNCVGLTPMLAGVQLTGDGRPLKVGLVYFDAHGDMNTPETTMSMMMGGMPVAVSCGLCLNRLRRQIGLEIPLPTKYVTFAGVRDTDPLEQEIIDNSDVEMLSVEDISGLTSNIDEQMVRLSHLSDRIYIHVDTDVLNPDEVPGHNTQVEGGVTSRELANCLQKMFKYPKTAAFGVASLPTSGDPDGLALKAVYRMIEGVINGVKAR